MTKPASEIKPMYAFSETNKVAIFEIIIDGMTVSSRIANLFSKRPSNATVLESIFEEQSMNYAIQYKDKVYRFHVRRLPSKINPNKTKIEYDTDKITIILKKKETTSWNSYAQDDFETDRK